MLSKKDGMTYFSMLMLYTGLTSGSDSDYEDIPCALQIKAESDSEKEEEVRPAIQLQNTQGLWGSCRKTFKNTVKKALFALDSLGINLPIFLDGLWAGETSQMSPEMGYEEARRLEAFQALP